MLASDGDTLEKMARVVIENPQLRFFFSWLPGRQYLLADQMILDQTC